MKKSVILTAIAGQIFTQSKNADGTPKKDKNGKEFGFIRVENPATIDLAYVHNNGGVKRGNSALVSMTLEAWDKAKAYYKEGMELPGNVRVVESLVKAHNGFQPKLAGANGTPCTLGGKPIYRSTEFDATGTLEDVIIKHDNVIAGSSVKSATENEALNG